MKHLLSAAAASALMAGTAFAGNIEPAPVEPVVAPAPMPVYQSPNWTGFYAGGQLGYADIDTNYSSAPFNIKGDGLIGGLTAGYDYDLGDWVIGAGADYDWTDIKLQSAANLKAESIWRLKARAGYKIGDGLLYATGGYAQMDTNLVGSEDGYFVGAGYEHLVTDNMSLGGELLYHEFKGFVDSSVYAPGPKPEAEVVSAQVRATFRF